jgi:hypothetical protein
MDKGHDSHVNLRSSSYVIPIADMGEWAANEQRVTCCTLRAFPLVTCCSCAFSQRDCERFV